MRRRVAAGGKPPRKSSLQKQLADALQREAAVAEVLKVIGRSAFDLQSALKTLTESATRLCGAKRGHIFRFDGEFLHFDVFARRRPSFQNRTGSEVITRKSGTCPVIPNWAVTLSRVRAHTIVLKPTSTVPKTRSEFGTTKSVKCGLVR
jgi:hypothetical protein